MATTNSVGNTYLGSSYEEYLNDQRVRKTQLGKNDFLNLLSAQMKYQDPLEPTKDSAFVAQLAQFSSLEQMEAMSTSMQAMQAQNLVGKYVYVVMDDGSPLEGFVDGMVYKNGIYYAQVGTTLINVNRINEVANVNNDLPNYANLIGQEVSAYTHEEKTVTVEPKEGEEDKEPETKTETVVVTRSGVVTHISLEGGIAMAHLKSADGNTYKVPCTMIFEIRGKAVEEAVVPPVDPPVDPNASYNNGVLTGNGNPSTDPSSETPPTLPPANGTIITPPTNPPVTEPDDDGGDDGNGQDEAYNNGLLTGNGGDPPADPPASGGGIIITN